MSDPSTGRPSAAAVPASIRRLPDGSVEIGWSDDSKPLPAGRATCSISRTCPSPMARRVDPHCQPRRAFQLR